jgi:hypothetical protein
VRVLGLILLLLGVLLTGASGLCTAAFIIPALGRGREGFGIILPFMFGGPFILIGTLMSWGGWRLSRRKPPPYDARDFD